MSFIIALDLYLLWITILFYIEKFSLRVFCVFYYSLNNKNTLRTKTNKHGIQGIFAFSTLNARLTLNAQLSYYNSLR